VVLVDVWEGTDARPEVALFRERWGIEATILLDETGEYARRLGLRGVPTNVLVDADGTIRAVGAVRLEELEAEVERLVGES
jgi:hypothetical protein